MGLISLSACLIRKPTRKTIFYLQTLLMLTIICSAGQDTGFWDGGAKHIAEWFKVHKCNVLCKRLKLKGAVVDIAAVPESDVQHTSGPLRHGFPSA